jgi:hypothetical protein
MSREETVKVLAVLRAAYPNFYKGMSKDDLVAIVNLWHTMFAADSYEAVSAAVLALIASKANSFPPVIGEIRQKMSDLEQGNSLTELEAWGLVSQAAANGYYGYKEEYEKLPPIVRRAVGRAEQLRDWAQMDAETFQSVVASNFMRVFRSVDKREKEVGMLPAEVQRLVLEAGNKMSLPSLVANNADKT